MKKHPAVLLLVLAALLGGACKGGGNAKDTGGATTLPPQSSSSAPPTTETAMSAKAKAAVLQAADFPAGFAPQPDEPGQGLGIETLWDELSRCLGMNSTAQRTGIAVSPTFLRGLATQGRSTVEYLAEPAAASATAALAGPKFQSCANPAFTADVKRSAPSGGVPGPVTIAARDVPPVAGATITAYRVTVTINLDELKVPLFQDFLVATKGQALIRMLFLNPGSEFPQDLERSLVEKVVGRA